MKKVRLRHQRVSDANKFYEILKSPKFIYFTANPESVEDEKMFLRKNKKKRDKNIEHNYTILYGEEVVGGIGIKVDQHRKHIGEIGYFVHEDKWGKGIATEAVRILEKIGFNDLKIKRMEIAMNPGNKSSIRVAVKAGYKKEGFLRSKILNRGKYEDAYLFAKVR